MNTHNMVHQFTHLHGAWRSVSNESKAGKSWMSEILIAIGLGVHRPGIVGLRLTSQKRFPKNTASSFEKWCSCPWKGQKHMKNVGLEDCSLPFSMPQCGTCSFRLQGCSWKMFGKVFFPKEFTQDQSSQGRRRFPETAAFWFPRWSYCLEGLQCSSRNFGVKAQSDTPQGGRTVDGSENRPTSNRFILPFTGLYIYISRISPIASRFPADWQRVSEVDSTSDICLSHYWYYCLSIAIPFLPTLFFARLVRPRR